MYVCLSFPLYISKLTEIAWAECEKPLYGVEEEGRKRDLEGLKAIFSYSFQKRKARNQKNW